MQEREFSFDAGSRSSLVGRTSVTAECPFCETRVVVFVWSFAGHGKKRCACGATLHRDGIARKPEPKPPRSVTK